MYYVYEQREEATDPFIKPHASCCYKKPVIKLLRKVISYKIFLIITKEYSYVIGPFSRSMALREPGRLAATCSILLLFKEAKKGVEIDEERIGMWGISLGGLYTMCIAALDQRIKAAIMCAFFMDRLGKITVESSHYSSWFLPHEEHLLIPGWFKGGFTDANLLSMVCPRALQITEGKKDPTNWWPLQVKEFQKL